MALTKCTTPTDIITNIGTTVNERGLTTEQFKAKFDESVAGIKNYINNTLTTDIDAQFATNEQLTTLSGEVDTVSNKVTTIETQIPTKVSATTADITYYVSPTGSDTNDGLTSGTAFKTIQYAINKLPQIINHTVTINITSGAYAEILNIKGFVGKGQLNLYGGNDLATAVSFSIKNLIAWCNTISISIRGISVTATNAVAFKITGCTCINFSYCISTVSVTGMAGFDIYSSLVRLNNNQINNRYYALSVGEASIVTSSNWTAGSGNTVGIISTGASTVGKYGTQPQGTTAESVNGGGVIR